MNRHVFLDPRFLFRSVERSLEATHAYVTSRVLSLEQPMGRFVHPPISTEELQRTGGQNRITILSLSCTERLCWSYVVLLKR